jgi:hypothetical protein
MDTADSLQSLLVAAQVWVANLFDNSQHKDATSPHVT